MLTLEDLLINFTTFGNALVSISNNDILTSAFFDGTTFAGTSRSNKNYGTFVQVFHRNIHDVVKTHLFATLVTYGLLSISKEGCDFLMGKYFKRLRNVDEVVIHRFFFNLRREYCHQLSELSFGNWIFKFRSTKTFFRLKGNCSWQHCLKTHR